MIETNYCPYCGYTGILQHESGTCTCLKCSKNYYILTVTGEKLYWDETWVRIKGFENLYEISNYLRIRSIPHTTAGKAIPCRILKNYPKRNELYVSLYKGKTRKEFNVRKLYRISVRETRAETENDKEKNNYSDESGKRG